MKTCAHCQTSNPDTANFCMTCGNELDISDLKAESTQFLSGINPFLLSLIGSIALSLLLIFVFRLPVFFLAAFLPPLWAGKKKSGS